MIVTHQIREQLHEVAGESRKSVILSQLKKLRTIDPMEAHIQATELLCEMLTSLGHGDIAEVVAQ